MAVEPVAPARRLRIAVLGDFDGVHTRSWLRWFIERGHDLHAVSFYPPSSPLDGATVHALRPRRRTAGQPWPRAATARAAGGPWLRGLVRLAHAARYRAAGLRRVVREIAPDVVHGHFVVEHGFYGALAGVRPYVVTAWGSDVLVEPVRDPVSRIIASWTLRRADAVTSNSAGRSRVHVVTLGADAFFLERADQSVNVRGRAGGAPVVLSTRAHEPLYNVAGVIDAMAVVERRRPGVRLVVAHGGSQTAALQDRARRAGVHAEFVGFVDAARLRDLMTDAEVFVSVPSSDAASVAVLQAMAAGCLPVLADLPTQREWVTDGVNGFLVPVPNWQLLAERIIAALDDAELRRAAAGRNRAIVEERGLNETQMARMEEIYLRLAGRA
jgi:glycosyltransferase involved in cell wall biosynthesis